MYRNYPENLGAGQDLEGACAPWPQHRTATSFGEHSVHLLRMTLLTSGDEPSRVIFLPRDAKRGIAIVCRPSVCPSVRDVEVP